LPITYPASLAAASFDALISSVGRQRGSVNYKNAVLIQIVKDTLPNGELAWQDVAIAYQKKAKEEKLRDWDDI
jgi:hypothetical protein